MEKKSQHGVEIRALIDASFIYRSYSEALDMMGIARLNKYCKYDEGNTPWVQPLMTVGSPDMPTGDKLHHKFAVIDQSIAITGSQNWSKNANHQNDEAVIILHSEVIAAHFSREFDRLYGHANFGVPHWLQDERQNDQIRCSQ